MRRFHFLIAVLVVALDRVTKWAVSKNISLHDGIQVIPGFFRLTHVENRGAAFGLFADSPAQWKIAVLVLFSIVALIIVSALLWRNSHSMSSTGIGLALILGERLAISGTAYSMAGGANFWFFTSANTNGPPSMSLTVQSLQEQDCWSSKFSS